VTLRLREDLPSLRNHALFADVRQALRSGRARFGFRLNHFSVQSNHMHLIVEATGRPSLSRGMQGLGVRLAKTINARLRRAGKVFADRYHDQILTCPKQVRNALEYVLKNARRHGLFHDGFDPYSSGAWFDGWRNPEKRHGVGAVDDQAPVVLPKTWMLTTGWRRHGLIPVQTMPKLKAEGD
jgi:REP element-mobilizing transposase RayT